MIFRNLLSDDSRINKFGMWIRTYSLDELPQLINVIKGEMSLVGPRPLLIEYLDLYDSEQKDIMFSQDHWLVSNQWKECYNLGRKTLS